MHAPLSSLAAEQSARGFAIGCLLLVAIVAAGQSTDDAQPTPPQSPETPVFTEQLEVNVVNLYVTVVDKKGVPVRGLTAADFVVKEGGRAVEITNFSEITAAFPDVAQQAQSPPPDAVGAEDAEVSTSPRQLVLVFDNTSLERQRRKWVMDDVGEWLKTVAADRGSVMVATIGPQLEIVQPFTSDGSAITAALKKAGKGRTQGDNVKSGKRSLMRDIQSARKVGTDYVSGIHTRDGYQRGRMLLAQIDTLRYQEYARLEAGLIALDRLMRGVSGLPGRKDILWIGEDLLMRPALSEYRMYFTVFGGWSQELSLDQPDIWASRLDLTRQFQYVGGVAQTASAVVHLVDASDRDREMATADFGTPDFKSRETSDASGPGATAGYGLARIFDVTDGSRFLAGTTGGTFFGESRNLGAYLELLTEVVGAYYSIGYQRPGAPDNKLHAVSVDVTGPGFEVRTHERVPNPSRDQRLVDMAVSRLLIDEGPNPLRLAVSPGGAELDEGGRYVRTIVLEIPADRLFLQQSGEDRAGRIAIAVVAADARGDVSPPRLLRMGVTIPKADSGDDVVARAELRIELDTDTVAVAAAVRDEGSGTMASALARVPD